MQWWDDLLNRPLHERLAGAFVVFCLALATGILIGTAIRPLLRHDPAPQESTQPVSGPDADGGVGGRPKASPQPQRTVRHKTAPTRKTKPSPTPHLTHRPPVIHPSHSPTPTPPEPTLTDSPTPDPTETTTGPPPADPVNSQLTTHDEPDPSYSPPNDNPDHTSSSSD